MSAETRERMVQPVEFETVVLDPFVGVLREVACHANWAVEDFERLWPLVRSMLYGQPRQWCVVVWWWGKNADIHESETAGR
jgi:hypothetical protein